MAAAEPEKVINGIIKKYLKWEGNLFLAEKLFVVNSIIQHLLGGGKYKSIDKKILLEYSILIDQYLKNDIDIRWEDGKLVVEGYNR